MSEPNFFMARMASIGITAETNRMSIYDPEAEHPQPANVVWPIFAEEKSSGDIHISYWTVDGEAIRYLQMGDGKTAALNAKTKYYECIRLKEPKGDMKYKMPFGQPTLPWFPPAVVEKFKKKERIDNLILTEGVFKAMSGSLHGLDIVGMPSITCYRERGGGIYRDIARLIETCEVQRVTILWDADCLDIGRKDLQTQEEATTRPSSFFFSAKKIGELVRDIRFTKTREKVSVYFAHVKADSLPGRPKGLDDLLSMAGERSAQVAKELRDLADKPFHFYVKNISGGTGPLYKYFRLDDAEAFYTFHQERIGSQAFKFKGSVHQWNELTDSLQMLAPEWAARVKWVGDEFFLDDSIPGAYGYVRRLIAYKQGQFTKMFGDGFWKYLQHHRAFVNIPSHFDYQQVIEVGDGAAKYYNRYFPFPHVPQEGRWGTIMQLLLHIFGTKEVTHALNGRKYQPVELALDYIQMLLCQPTQMLPVLCLYSPENNTGKSTLGKLLMAMFGDNAIQIGNSDLQSEFNELFTDKLLAICEETLLERKRDAERIKAMSTSDKITVNPKGQKQYTIDYFCKFLFTSNNLRMIYLTRHDQRYWIVRVPVVASENPNMLDDMKAEIPAFVHHLKNRQMATPKEGRMWFHHSLLKTSILDDMVRVNEPTDAANMRDELAEWFIADRDTKEIRMTLKEIREEFFSNHSSIAWVKEIVKDYLGADLLRNPVGDAVFERGHYVKYEKCFNQEMKQDEIVPVKKPYRGKPYVFFREMFIGDEGVEYPGVGVQQALELHPVAGPPLGHPPVILTAMNQDDLPF
jgi:hypothetical protein